MNCSMVLAAVVGLGAPDGDSLDTYVQSLLQIRNGYVDVAALDLPDDFLRRAAGRSIRLRFRQQFRQVVEDAAVVATAPPAPSGAAVVHVEISADLVQRWRGYTARAPGLRGFRAPVGRRGVDWPMDAPSDGRQAAHRVAATYVARHLATDGLIATTMGLMRHIDLGWLSDDGRRLDQQTLRAVGLPVDLLAMFHMPDRLAADAIAAWYRVGAPGGSIPLTRNEAVFRFVPSRKGFVVSPGDGSRSIRGIRLQIDGKGFTRGPGDGSALDLAGQLLAAIPDVRVWLSVQDTGVEALLAALAGPTDRLEVVPTPLPVSTWAGDGSMVGHDHGRRPVTLIPRYASGDETTTRFVPGDSFVFETVAAVVGDVVQSCLVFQGGNLLPVVVPATGESILLIGEREVYRNRALGLTGEQVLDAFRIEFGVDRCEVLPAVSLHLDMEMTVRARGEALVACLPDEVAAARIVLTAAVGALVRGGAMTDRQLDAVVTDIRRDEPLAAIRALNEVIGDYYDSQGRLTPLFTSMFVAAPVESGAGNALRLLVAMDILTAHAITASGLDGLSDESRQYLQTFRLRAQDRRALAARLETLGMVVALIPSMSDEEAGINALNGIHLPGAYLVPTFGGLYRGVDEAAASALRRAFGLGVEIRPLRSAALQAAYGGPHGASSVYPGLGPAPE